MRSWAVLFFMISFAAACGGAPVTDSTGEDQVIPPEPAAPATLRIENRSDVAIHRVWFSPNDADDMNIGFDWLDVERIEAGADHVGEIDRGAWDLWVEAEDASDFVLRGFYFNAGQESVIVVNPSFWVRGDWIIDE